MLRASLGLFLTLVPAVAQASAPDDGPCATKTTEPGFIVASQHDPKIYLDVYQGQLTFPRSYSERRSLYSYSLLHHVFTSGCADFRACLTPNVTAATANGSAPLKMTVDASCKFATPAADQQFSTLDDGSITLFNGKAICLGVSADGQSILADKCGNIDPENRFYWVDWD